MRTRGEHLAQEASAPHEGDGPEQLSLNLPSPARREPGGPVVTEANRQAVIAVQRPDLWPGPMAVLIGGPGAGKSLIGGHFFVGATRLDPGCFDDPLAAARMSPEGAAGRFWFDDLDRAHDALAAAEPALRRFESGLFHLLNQLAAEGGRLLAAARSAPARWPVATPDLASRLQAALALRVEPPDDAMMLALLERSFEERGLRAPGSLIEFLMLRIERSAAEAARVVGALDAAAYRAGRRLDRRLAEEILAEEILAEEIPAEAHPNAETPGGERDAISGLR